MAWSNDPEKRRRDAEHYRNPEFVRNKPLVVRRANGRCEQCGKRASRIEVDHTVPLSVRVDHSLGNLRGLCTECHQVKTAKDSHAGRQAKRPAPRPRTQW
jgi:5-methylcytosine-specific restriction endonuclease McrA